MSRTSFAAAVVVAGSTMLLACSSGGTGAGADGGDAQVGDASLDGAPGSAVTVSLSTSCPALTACGGDPTGTWNVSSACIVAAPPVPSCPAATVSGTLTLSGGISFDPTTFTNSVRVSAVAITITIPGSCASACNTPLSSLAQAYNNASCGMATSSGCTCVDDFGGQNGFADSYAIDAGTISHGGSMPIPFCLTGSTLQIQSFPLLSGSNLPNVITFTH